MEKKLYLLKSVMIGHAVGDALGVPVEFRSREQLDADPVTDMMGFGTYAVPAGAWSDDTSMSLAALDVLTKKDPSFEAVMQRFADWLLKGKYTPTGCTFDVGGTCRAAITEYLWNKIPVCGKASDTLQAAPQCGRSDERSNGNGSLMRIHPFVLYAHFNSTRMYEWMELIKNASCLTHAHERSVLGCLIYTFVLFHLFADPNKDSVALALRRAQCHLRECPELVHYQRLWNVDFAKTPRNGIKSSGYVVDTLEAAIWCLLTTDSYRECVLKAVNLGEDTDTVAAVAGGLAGALYGYDAIPEEWKSTLLKREYIEEMCERAARAWGD